MKKILKNLKIGKRKRIRALRLEEEKEKKNKPRFNNPYFYNNKNSKKINISNFLYWFLKKDGWAYCGIFLIILGSFLFLIFSTDYFVIKNISLEGNKRISKNDIEEPLYNYLNSKFLFFIPRNNLFFAKDNKIKTAIEENILDNFALENLEVNKKWPNTIEIKISERIPGFTWVDFNENYYYIDLNGKISQKIENKNNLDKDLPIIIDENERTINLDEQVISKELIDFILLLEESLKNKNNLKRESYVIPKITCQEQKYKAEKIIKDEIAETEDEEVKEAKKEILKKYNNGEITIDESLTMLENIKKEELINNNLNINEDVKEYVKWETVFVEKECDYLKINRDINVELEQGFSLYFDNKINLEKQLSNLNSLLKKIDKNRQLEYIDLRYEDRIYYK